MKVGQACHVYSELSTTWRWSGEWVSHLYQVGLHEREFLFLFLLLLLLLLLRLFLSFPFFFFLFVSCPVSFWPFLHGLHGPRFWRTPEFATLFLLTENAGELLPTIRSRSMIVNLGALATTEIESRLAQLRPSGNARQRGLVARLSEGAIGRARPLISKAMSPLATTPSSC